MRPIDADALLEKVWDADTRAGYVQVVDWGDIEEAPTIEPERKRGRWIDGECSACGYGVEPWNNTPYCPNCGAYNER